MIRTDRPAGILHASNCAIDEEQSSHQRSASRRLLWSKRRGLQSSRCSGDGTRTHHKKTVQRLVPCQLMMLSSITVGPDLTGPIRSESTPSNYRTCTVVTSTFEAVSPTSDPGLIYQKHPHACNSQSRIRSCSDVTAPVMRGCSCQRLASTFFRKLLFAASRTTNLPASERTTSHVFFKFMFRLKDLPGDTDHRRSPNCPRASRARITPIPNDSTPVGAKLASSACLDHRAAESVRITRNYQARTNNHHEALALMRVLPWSWSSHTTYGVIDTWN